MLASRLLCIRTLIQLPVIRLKSAMATASAPVPGTRKSRKKEPLGVTTGTSKTGEEVFTFFYGTDTPFSQFHPAQFEVKGQQYNCAEQYMMHQKAGET